MIKNLKTASTGFLHEFKAFAIKGNVIDLAVGVVIGGAFGKIVGSLVDNIVMPVVGLLTGRVDFSSLFLVIWRPEGADAHFKTLQAARDAGATAIGYGLFINSVVQFTIVAFAIFILIKQINRLKREEEVAPTVTPPRQEVLLEEIRDILKTR
jgi:large conductance mechanosensitive channel